jgi:choline dehydrogenase
VHQAGANSEDRISTEIEPIAKTCSSDHESLEQDFETPNFIERVRANQQKLTADLKPHYDFIVCGSGSSGSVVARRLAENRLVDVLLVEVGGSDDLSEVMEASKWLLNRASERNWGFLGQPSRHLNGRSIGISAQVLHPCPD